MNSYRATRPIITPALFFPEQECRSSDCLCLSHDYLICPHIRFVFSTNQSYDLPCDWSHDTGCLVTDLVTVHYNKGLGPVLTSEETHSGEIDSNSISLSLKLSPYPLQQNSCPGTEWNDLFRVSKFQQITLGLPVGRNTSYNGTIISNLQFR
jgi:hypothetical protein